MGYKELQKIYPKYENNKLRLKYLRVQINFNIFLKNKILDFLNSNKKYIDGNYYLFEKLCLGCLEDNDLIEEKLSNEYNKFLFNYKYQLEFNTRNPIF